MPHVYRSVGYWERRLCRPGIHGERSLSPSRHTLGQIDAFIVRRWQARFGPGRFPWDS